MNKKQVFQKLKCQFCGLIIDESYYEKHRMELEYHDKNNSTGCYYHHIDKEHSDEYEKQLDNYSISALEELLEEAEKL